MQNRPKRRLLIPVIAASLLAGAIWIGYRATVYIVPKAVLSAALNRAFAQLEERYADSPLRILSPMLGWEGMYRADVTASVTDGPAGDTCCEMLLHVDAVTKRILAQGQLRSEKGSLNADVYLDASGMAISSAELLGGSFYGITYRSFPEDIRSFPMLPYILPERTLTQWEEAVASIQTVMSKSYAPASLPQLTQGELQTLLLGLMALPCQAEDSVASVDGQDLVCRRLSYRAEGAISEDSGQTEEIEADFYLYDRQLVKLRIAVSQAQTGRELSVSFGTDILAGPVLVRYTETDGNDRQTWVASVSTGQTEGIRQTFWTLHSSGGEEEASTSFSYSYDPVSGQLELTVGQGSPQRLLLKNTQEGIFLESEDFLPLAQTLLGKKSASTETKIACRAVLSPGEGVEEKQYKSMDAWSVEDLAVLLQGIGSLLWDL